LRKSSFSLQIQIKGGLKMQEVRNALDKLVCCIDKENKIVEIVIKGQRTIIQFLSDGTVKIENAYKVA